MGNQDQEKVGIPETSDSKNSIASIFRRLNIFQYQGHSGDYIGGGKFIFEPRENSVEECVNDIILKLDSTEHNNNPLLEDNEKKTLDQSLLTQVNNIQKSKPAWYKTLAKVVEKKILPNFLQSIAKKYVYRYQREERKKIVTIIEDGIANFFKAKGIDMSSIKKELQEIEKKQTETRINSYAFQGKRDAQAEKWANEEERLSKKQNDQIQAFYKQKDSKVDALRKKMEEEKTSRIHTR